MFSSRMKNYFVSERGRSFTFGVVCVSGLSLFVGKYLPNTVCIEKYREFLQLYKNGFEREVPDKVRRRFDYALEACNLSEHEKRFVQPFMAYGFDTVSIGTAKSRFGALVGIPSNYTYDSKAHIEKGDIQIRDKEISWTSPEAERLQDALLLTEDEQIFGIARSILQISSHKLFITSLYAPVVVFSVYNLASTINRRGNLYARPLGLRCVLYSIVGMFGYGVYSFLKDYTEVYYDTAIDKQLCQMGPEFVDAGARFYQKLLQKNIAVRNLNQDNSYTASGNLHFGLRQKSLPLTIRKSYFEQQLEEFKKTQSLPNDVPVV